MTSEQGPDGEKGAEPQAGLCEEPERAVERPSVQRGRGVREQHCHLGVLQNPDGRVWSQLGHSALPGALGRSASRLCPVGRNAVCRGDPESGACRRRCFADGIRSQPMAGWRQCLHGHLHFSPGKGAVIWRREWLSQVTQQKSLVSSSH